MTFPVCCWQPCWAFPSTSPRRRGRLTPDDFPEGLGDLYAAIDGTWSAKGEMDVVDVLHRYPDLKETVAACMDALDVAPVKVTRSRVREWVTALLEHRALERFQALAVQAASPSTSYEDLAALYGRMGQALDTDHPGEDFTPLGDLIDDYIRNLDPAAKLHRHRHRPSGPEPPHPAGKLHPDRRPAFGGQDCLESPDRSGDGQAGPEGLLFQPGNQPPDSGPADHRKPALCAPGTGEDQESPRR